MNNQQAIDRLVKHLEWGWSEETVEAIKMGIHALEENKWIPCSEKMPEEAAFDVEDVVSDLEQLKLDGACNNEDCGHCKYFMTCWDGEMSDRLALDKAIEIVKRG